ncbi:Uncharacterised protein [Delftia tsuruhatensis]|nr:Uncharacterised protein [Delftia tsuruhatensis]CAC9689067.1 Uncharacterised protein [Delftia tsuruhatensis]
MRHSILIEILMTKKTQTYFIDVWSYLSHDVRPALLRIYGSYNIKYTMTIGSKLRHHMLRPLIARRPFNVGQANYIHSSVANPGQQPLLVSFFVMNDMLLACPLTIERI